LERNDNAHLADIILELEVFMIWNRKKNDRSNMIYCEYDDQVKNTWKSRSIAEKERIKHESKEKRDAKIIHEITELEQRFKEELIKSDQRTKELHASIAKVHEQAQAIIY